jgi:hypothetical protein
LNRVFSNRHETLAIEHLKLQTTVRTSFRKGPRDVEREQDLAEVEERIAQSAQDKSFGLTFVDDCLEAAEIARDLERPWTEVDGRFDRAERVANEYGSRHQQFIYAYSRAWTSYWWHEDYPAFLRHFATAEKLVEGSRNVYELELLTNLWNILHSLVVGGEVDATAADLERRTTSLESALERLVHEEDRPSTSLQARALGLMVRLVRARAGDTAAIFKELESVFRDSSGLVGFPLEALAESLTELGKYLGQHPGYEELFETILEVTTQQGACFRRLKWLELRLGRIPQLFVRHHMDCAVRRVLASRGYRSPNEEGEEFSFDAILGILLLRTDPWQLRRLSRLPDVLDRLGLFNASIALRFALGDVASVEADLKTTGIEKEELTDYFCRWRDQPAGEELPSEVQGTTLGLFASNPGSSVVASPWTFQTTRDASHWPSQPSGSSRAYSPPGSSIASSRGSRRSRSRSGRRTSARNRSHTKSPRSRADRVSRSAALHSIGM